MISDEKRNINLHYKLFPFFFRSRLFDASKSNTKSILSFKRMDVCMHEKDAGSIYKNRRILWLSINLLFIGTSALKWHRSIQSVRLKEECIFRFCLRHKITMDFNWKKWRTILFKASLTFGLQEKKKKKIQLMLLLSTVFSCFSMEIFLQQLRLLCFHYGACQCWEINLFNYQWLVDRLYPP